jgi:hypothetical protein
MLVDYQFRPINLQPKRDPLGLVRGDYIMFLAANFSKTLNNKHEFYSYFFVGKQHFFARIKIIH